MLEALHTAMSEPLRDTANRKASGRAEDDAVFETSSRVVAVGSECEVSLAVGEVQLSVTGGGAIAHS